MSTIIIPSSKRIRNTSTSENLTTQSSKSGFSNLKRLATFSTADGDIHPTFSKSLFAKMGFYRKQNENIVECEGCHFTIELSASQDELIKEHLKYNSACSFISNNNEIYSSNDRKTLSYTQNTLRTNHPIENIQQFNTNSFLNNDDTNRIPQKSFLYRLSDKIITELRMNTFSNWPLITPNAQNVCRAGWYYTNIADRVICPYCDALYHKWTETDQPYEIHRLKSPKCPFVLAVEKNGTLAQTTAIAITATPNTQVSVDVVQSPYALSCRRQETFANWPDLTKDTLPSIQSFVDAGFYYTGNETIVRCFYCQGALRNWQANDEPKIEHARWFPNCAYIRQYIGEDLYEAIQRKNSELKAQQNNGQKDNTQSSQSNTWSSDELDRMVKARLDLPVIENLRQAGFNMAIIRKTFEMQLRFKKDDFKSDNDLHLACLILELQVQLINGNEANLLIPQDWIRKYFENPKRNTEQMQSSQPEIPITKTVEVPKVIAPTIAQPKITQSTDDDTPLCVLCLTTERQVACLPCGHLTSCVACGHSLKTCPICRTPVRAFVRIYT